MEDDFYGYQFLNGVNPTVIQRCSELPSNFAVTEEMIQPFLEDGSCLHEEMKVCRKYFGRIDTEPHSQGNPYNVK